MAWRHAHPAYAQSQEGRALKAAEQRCCASKAIVTRGETGKWQHSDGSRCIWNEEVPGKLQYEDTPPTLVDRTAEKVEVMRRD